MRIEVRRTGGFAGIERRARVDTRDLPDADAWHRLAEAALTGDTGDAGATTRDGARGGCPHGGTGAREAGPRGVGARGAGVPDGFHYEITVDGRTAHCAEPDLTEAQRELVSRVLREGA
ncbi:protealysin inhibitor emfourin [Streptomyces sp. DH12]|uniref:protealysin inhibitor emfourin n=1 Tax=Streptomyces sp. DH12 TaxID=2857010 RepID=UPI001E5EE482|nr:protealysin inhibitor emfourin [Streptomyces sp. DH12]